MSTVASISTPDHPDVRTFWQDENESNRWSLGTSNAAILVSLLSLLATSALARLIYIVYTLIHICILRRKSRSIVDDQVNVIAANTQNPLSLLTYLIHLSFVARRRTLNSNVWWTLAVMAVLFLAIQGATVYLLGRLVVSGPVPMSFGICGFPKAFSTADHSIGLSSNESQKFGKWDAKQAELYERASSRFLQCHDGGEIFTCPGPSNRNVSWEVFESEPSYCWFGEEHCFNGSRTITQKATINPIDMGTIRRSRVSFTILEECSHVNASKLIKSGYDASAVTPQSYTDYLFGPCPPLDQGVHQNATFIVYGDEQLTFSGHYRLDNRLFPTPQGSDFWSPASFLINTLNQSFLLDNETSSSSLMLLFNRILTVNSAYRNDDPMFYTDRTIDNETSTYPPGRDASTVACRERLQVRIDPSKGSGLNETWVATGGWNEIIRSVMEVYDNKLSHYDTDRDLGVELLLIEFGARAPLLYSAITGLGGNAIRAERSVMNSIQYDQNVSSRNEITRWFGVSLLFFLYMPQMWTSGTDNDWGFGIVPLNQSWICDSTLWTYPTYVSAKVVPVIAVIVAALVITLISWMLERMLWCIASKTHGVKVSKSIGKGLVTQNLHNLLQLHRMAIQRVSNYKFSRTLDTIPHFEETGASDNEERPLYGITRSLSEDELLGGDRVEVMDTTDRKGGRDLYATLLRSHEQAMDIYDINRIR